MRYYDLLHEEQLKIFDCIYHCIAESQESEVNRLSLNNIKLIESYISRELELHIHLSILRNGIFTETPAPNFVALFWNK